MDQLPFFLRPLWHTFHATLQGSDAALEDLTGMVAMQRLDLQFFPSDGHRLPTEVFLTVDVPSKGTVSIFLDVLKSFIQIREFSYACEKGFDVGSAAWFEQSPVDESGLPSHRLGIADFRASLAPMQSTGPLPSVLRFTEGLLILVPMPDFSMPFNVIALSSTAVTFFFGSLFRLTAAGRVPHWVLKKDEKPKRGLFFWFRRVVFAALLGGLYALYAAEAAQLRELREALPAAAAPVMDFLDSVKATVEQLLLR